MPWRKPAPQIGIALLAATAALGQPPAVERGSQVYRPNCGFCHGVDARGDAAPDLARSLVVLEDTDGRALGAFLRSGRPDSGMPAFAGLSPEQSADLAAFLHTKIE